MIPISAIRYRNRKITVLLTILPILALISLAIGGGDSSLAQLVVWWRGGTAEANQFDELFWSLRVPRLAAALLTGSSLGMVGAMLQSATGNQLAEPGLLGVNSAAALGVILGLSLGAVQSASGYLPWAAGGALAGCAALLLITRGGYGVDAPCRLILAGAAFNATLYGISSAILLSQATTFDQYRFWQLGSLSGVTGDAVCATAPAVLSGLVLTQLLGRPLAALALGDDAARSLGYHPLVTRCAVVLAISLLAGSAVALAGPIAFLGLLAPLSGEAAYRPEPDPGPACLGPVRSTANAHDRHRRACSSQTV